MDGPGPQEDHSGCSALWPSKLIHALRESYRITLLLRREGVYGMGKCKCNQKVYCAKHRDELERLIREQRRDFAGSHWNGHRWVYEWARDAQETRFSLAARRNFHGL